MDRAKLSVYFATWEKPYEHIPAPGPPPAHPGAMDRLQFRWLGLGAEFNLAMKIPNLEKALAIRRSQQGIEKLLAAKGLPLPGPIAWRHPELPYGWYENYQRDLLAFPREVRAEMPKKGRSSQTGEESKKGRKGKAIHPKPTKIKGV